MMWHVLNKAYVLNRMANTVVWGDVYGVKCAAARVCCVRRQTVVDQ